MATPKKKPNTKAANAAQSTVKTDGIDDVRKACQEMGDMLKETGHPPEIPFLKN